jgi:hypothetical protein
MRSPRHTPGAISAAGRRLAAEAAVALKEGQRHAPAVAHRRLGDEDGYRQEARFLGQPPPRALVAAAASNQPPQ